MMTKHTPGPWHVHDGDTRFLFIDSATEGSVCKIAVNHHEEANARLIASAPDLLEALEEIVNLAKGSYRLMNSSILGDTHGRPIVDKAEAAIARAKGKP